MSIHLGHIYGLRLIKEALETSEDDATKYVNEPIGEGSDKGERRVSEMFDSMPEIDKMIPEDMGKTGAEAAFDANTEMPENRPNKDRKSIADRNENEEPTEKVWRDHDSFTPMSDDNIVVDHIPEPGPAP